jgi:hypothetical protein
MTWPFRRKPAQAPTKPALTRADAAVLNKAGLTLAEWDALPESKRADYRWNIGLGGMA